MTKIPDGTYSVEKGALENINGNTTLLFKPSGAPFPTTAIVATLAPYTLPATPMLTLPQRKTAEEIINDWSKTKPIGHQIGLKDMVLLMEEYHNQFAVSVSEENEYFSKLKMLERVRAYKMSEINWSECKNAISAHCDLIKSATPSQGIFTREQMEQALRHGYIARQFDEVKEREPDLDKLISSYFASLTPTPKEIEVKDGKIKNVKY